MDQFEAARQKHAKNLERKLRTLRPEPQAIVSAIEESIVPSVGEEEKASKASPDAIFEVVVRLPDRVLSFEIRKRNVMANVNPRLLNKNDIAKAIKKGLEPLMGGVE